MQRVSDNLRQVYEAHYESHDENWRTICSREKAQNIIFLCAPHPHSSVIEIGCGDGAILERLREADFAQEISGIEISSKAVEFCRRKGLNVVLFDGYTVPGEHYELAFLSHVVEHLEHPRQLLYAAAKIADYVFVEVPTEDNWRLSPDFVLDEVGHINYYSPKTARLLLQSCGLEIIKEQVTDSSNETYRYLYNKKGAVKRFVKSGLLAIVPQLATQMFTYRYSAIARLSPKHQIAQAALFLG